ncbi:MAG: hypothetical protein GYA24_07565 [Candidatus Lokiarchaeota archaeon]|nr:hypothetical protein [Candidatus Lokiarchaeota archaeon]
MAATIDAFMAAAKAEGEARVAAIHALSYQLWHPGNFTPESLQARCIAAWDTLGREIGSRIEPLVPVPEDRPVTNVIFGSGGFSTGAFQAMQFKAVKQYASHPPVLLSGIVANKSRAAGCNASVVASDNGVPLVELDFATWYREHVDKAETNPIAASRYWFPKDDPARPEPGVMASRFSIRQDRYHAALGEGIARAIGTPIDIASARGYSFQFCSAMFKQQRRNPHVNDTHPADLTYVDPPTGTKLYPGWQSGAIQLMMKARHATFRGSLIEVGFMDTVAQVDQLDEGALLAIGGGVAPDKSLACTADQVQAAMKLVDDHVFCTIEPTGLILAWGITEKPVRVTYQDVNGQDVVLRQKAIVVGDQVRAGKNAWGCNLSADLLALGRFLLNR